MSNDNVKKGADSADPIVRSVKVGKRGVHVGGTVGGSVITGDVETNGGDFAGRDMNKVEGGNAEVDALFVELLRQLVTNAGVGEMSAVVEQTNALKEEAKKGEEADDTVMSTLISGLAGLVPKGVSALVSAFASPLLGGVAGVTTQIVLDRLKIESDNSP